MGLAMVSWNGQRTNRMHGIAEHGAAVRYAADEAAWSGVAGRIVCSQGGAGVMGKEKEKGRSDGISEDSTALGCLWTVGPCTSGFLRAPNASPPPVTPPPPSPPPPDPLPSSLSILSPSITHAQQGARSLGPRPVDTRVPALNLALHLLPSRRSGVSP